MPVDALVFSPKAKYIYIGRDGRDVVWSMYNHHANANEFWYQALNDTPGRVGPAIEKPVENIVQYYNDWLEKDGYPFWPFWENILSWWQIQNLPNVHLIHFAKLKEDMPGEIKKVADFLDIKIDPSKWDAILEHCSFDYMKKHSLKSVPLGGAFWDGGSDTFINKGINGRWKEMLGGTIDDTVAILEQLKSTGQYKLYALTNWSNETFPIALTQYPFLQWFDGIVVSGREKMRKPHACFYELLLNRYHVNAADALFIDDNLRNVTAAEACGIESIHFTSPDQLKQVLTAKAILS